MWTPFGFKNNFWMAKRSILYCKQLWWEYDLSNKKPRVRLTLWRKLGLIEHALRSRNTRKSIYNLILRHGGLKVIFLSSYITQFKTEFLWESMKNSINFTLIYYIQFLTLSQKDFNKINAYMFRIHLYTKYQNQSLNVD